MKSIMHPACMSVLLLAAIFIGLSPSAKAQVKVGNNPNTIDNNSLFEMETTNKGLLPPRVALNSSSSASPLTAPVPSGMTVFSIGGTLTDGYYFWNGSKWIRLITSDYSNGLVAKTSSCTLLKTETLVLASNDITLTLPTITSDDNGLSITIKNNGTYTDYVTITGATQDNLSNSYLTRYQSRTFVAYNSVWIIKDREPRATNIFDVGPQSSWTTIAQVVDFLNEHISSATVVRFASGSYTVAATQIINFAYPVTFQGLSYGTTTFGPASGLSGLPMFDCRSECYFKMLMFDATTLAGYGSSSGEDAIQLKGSKKYNEIKDCTFEGFHNAIKIASNAELWLFECDIISSKLNGILLQCASGDSTKLRVSETDFMECPTGVNMDQGTKIIVQLDLGAYDNINGTDTCIRYNPVQCTFAKMQINYNAWNNIGGFLSGFDFSRSDGRDANAYIESNAGIEDKNPHVKINVRNNTTKTIITVANSWYKANWTNTTVYPCKWQVTNNYIKYLQDNKRDVVAYITGNIMCNASHTVSIGLVKNGVSTTRYGECDLRITTASQPFQFATVIYLEDVKKSDYFELYCTATGSSDEVTFQDVQWFTEVK